MKPKIAVYTIALNEEKHVRRWYDSAKDADLLLIADTGSTDKTKFVARSLGVEVYEIEVNPWRFDVARNASLALIPEDFDLCIQLDMDEILSEHWRNTVTQAWNSGNIWPTYKHVTSRDKDGKPRSYQHYFKIHPRKDFVWKYPIHEVLVPTSDKKYSRELIDLEVDHLKDHTKTRESYLGLLELAVEEMPSDWRMNHYLCREYMYNREWLKVLQTTYKSLDLVATWDVEQASSYMWASEAAWNLGMKPLAEEWARKATEAAPNFYEAWHWRAHIAQLRGKWQECFEYASKKNALTRADHHLVKPEVWEWSAEDLIALSLHKMGFHEYALEHGLKAYLAKKSDERLKNNLHWYAKSLRAAMESEEWKEEEASEKLKGLPKIYILNLDESQDRLKIFQESAETLGITNWVRVGNRRLPKVGRIMSSHLDLSIHKSLENGYKLMLEKFLESGDDYCLLCEDDLDLKFGINWPWNWTYKFNQYKGLDFDGIQLSLLQYVPSAFNLEIHTRAPGLDWSLGCTLVSRTGAQRMLHKIMSSNSERPIESVIYDGLKVFSEGLMICDSDSLSTTNVYDIETTHRPSWARQYEHCLGMSMRLLNQLELVSEIGN